MKKGGSRPSPAGYKEYFHVHQQGYCKIWELSNSDTAVFRHNEIDSKRVPAGTGRDFKM